MSTVYRKSGREFYKIEQNRTVTTVVNKLKHSWISIIENKDVVEEVVIDRKVATEEEFNTAYKEAMDRIQSGKI